MAGNGDSTLEVPPTELHSQVLIKYISSLFKKELIQKPPIFSATDEDIQHHIKTVDNYIKSLGISDDLSKVTILFESLDQRVKNAVIFEPSYDDNSGNYKWVCEKLIALFPRKINQTSTLINLLNLRQNSKSLDEFILEIKNSVASNDFIEKADREKLAIEILLKGLDDQKVSAAISMQNPNSIKQVKNMITSVKTSNTEFNSVNRISPQLNDSSLHDEVIKLQKQVAYLTQMLLAVKSKMSEHPIERTRVQKGFSSPSNRKRESQEWTYPKYNRRENVTCFKCKKRGHVQRNCRLNSLIQNDYFSDCDTKSNSSENPVMSSSSLESSVPKVRLICQKPPKQIVKPRQIKYPDEIIELENYINGKTNKPLYSDALKSQMCKAITVKNSSNNSKNNKPIIKGRLNNSLTSLFMDTGACVNVVDASFLKKNQINSLQRPNNKAFHHSIKCANNTKMNVIDKVSLSVQIGVTEKLLNFLVVDSLSPKVIIGLRGMKTLGAEIIPSRDLVKCHGIEIPFMGKTSLDSCISKNVKWVH